MNPEFVRNLWLEASPFRLALIAGLLLLVFSAESVSMASAGPATIGQTAQLLYFFFAVLWGTRNAALSVVGEIRERTWDGQKLSSIGPVEMVWGKLFGATVQNWFGGLLCLAVLAWQTALAQGAAAVLAASARLLLLGVLAQSVALLSSLMVIRRNTGNWRLDIFLCQVAGIAAAYSFGSALTTLQALTRTGDAPLTWWNRSFNAAGFHLVSLVLFTGWALVGCWRAMRAELRFTNGPFYWLAWLAFLFVYQAGLESMLPARLDAAQLHGTVPRVALGGLAVLGTAYGMAFLEPKDPVRIRWLEEQAAAGRWWRAFLALDAWMLSYAVTLAIGLVLALLMVTGGAAMPDWALAVLAMLGFLTRDIAIFVLLRGRAGGRGDFAALAVLGALYILLPMLVRGAALPLTPLFLPTAGSLLSLAAAWTQGLVVALWARRSLHARS